MLAGTGTIIDEVNTVGGMWDNFLTGKSLVNNTLRALTTLPYTSDGVFIHEQFKRTLIIHRTITPAYASEISQLSFGLFVKFTLARWLLIQGRAEADHQMLHTAFEKLRYTRQLDIPTWAEIVTLSQSSSGKSY